MSNLEELTIAYNTNLESVIIPSITAQNIKSLSIIHNPKLMKMPSLKAFKNLSELALYGNERISMEQEGTYVNLVSNICAHPERTYELDIKYYKYFYNYFMNSQYQDIKDDFFENSNWNEMVFPTDNQKRKLCAHGKTWRQVPVTYSSKQMQNFHEKCMSIVSTYVMLEDSDLEKLAAISRWMWENVEYDDKGLENKERYYSKEITIKKENGETETITSLEGKAKGTNGSVNAILYGCCVCQGYTRTINYLGSLSGLRMYDIHCDVIKEEVTNLSKKDPNKCYKKLKKADGTMGEFRVEPHSMSQGFITHEGKKYQFFMDNTWDAGSFKKSHTAPYFLVDKKEFDNKRVFTQFSLSKNGIIESHYPIFVINGTKKAELIRMMDQRFEEIKNNGRAIIPTGSKK